MTNSQAWDYAIGMIKVDGLEPTSVYVRTAFVAYNAFFSDGTDFSKQEYLERIVHDALKR